MKTRIILIIAMVLMIWVSVVRADGVERKVAWFDYDSNHREYVSAKIASASTDIAKIATLIYLLNNYVSFEGRMAIRAGQKIDRESVTIGKNKDIEWHHVHKKILDIILIQWDRGIP